MTTNIRVAIAPDLFVVNEVMNFHQAHLPENRILAGASWLATESSPFDALLSVFKFVFGSIRKKLADHNVWLLVGTLAWQPNTSIVRHHGLWGALRARGLVLLNGSQYEEFVLESEGKLKFFGATKLSEDSAEGAVNILLREPCTYLIALPGDLSPRDIIEIGWLGSLADDSKIIDYIDATDGLLLKQIGEFDAHERGIVAVGQPRIVNTLLN